MPHSLGRVYVHLVLSTKNQVPWLVDRALRERSYGYMAGIFRNLRCPALWIGGVEDHVHVLFRLSRVQPIVRVVGKVRTASSDRLRLEGISDFDWKDDYGAFSVSPQNVDRVVRYIKNQEEIHREVTFTEEYGGLLERSEGLERRVDIHLVYSTKNRIPFLTDKALRLLLHGRLARPPPLSALPRATDRRRRPRGQEDLDVLARRPAQPGGLRLAGRLRCVLGQPTARPVGAPLHCEPGGASQGAHVRGRNPKPVHLALMPTAGTPRRTPSDRSSKGNTSRVTSKPQRARAQRPKPGVSPRTPGRLEDGGAGAGASRVARHSSRSAELRPGRLRGVRPARQALEIMQDCIMLSCIIMKFINRKEEMQRLDRLAESADGGLAVLYGRRRIGKTRLLLRTVVLSV